ncbi:hypothetical protein Undi14_14340 [Undibacterium sp. 14-3-2]|nr:hypothetical protein [Undibacterium sp. 14-3-2]
MSEDAILLKSSELLLKNLELFGLSGNGVPKTSNQFENSISEVAMKIKAEERGIAIGGIGFFCCLLGFGISLIGADNLGVWIMWASWAVIVWGMLLHFRIMSKRK